MKTRKSGPLEKFLTGIEGLDAITRGGLPRGRTTVVLGGAGSGKTVLALQSLVHGARERGEPGIFVAFEENSREIMRNAASFGWDLPALERQRLLFLDARPGADVQAAGSFDLRALIAGVEARARAMGARRIVFDSIDVLLGLMGDPPRERQELQRLHEWTQSSGLSVIVTGKDDDSDERHAMYRNHLQFMADCVLQLRHVTLERHAQRDLQVIKYRGSSFAGNPAPMVIAGAGIRVAHVPDAERNYRVEERRISSGVPALDEMLSGGYFKGSTVLVTGAPGTAKTTLAGSFAAAACRRGERVLLVSFDEIAGEHARNLSSVGIDLARHLASGRLRIYAARSEATGVEEHLVAIHDLLREHRASAVIFDPLSALFRAGDPARVENASERLLGYTKHAGLTCVCTSLLTGPDGRIEGTPLGVSTVADTWIHLSYAINGGERNRALTVVKSRGTAHSNQVRELLLGSKGVQLADVYAADGEVLMGTLRWQREQLEAREEQRRTAENARRRGEIRVAESEIGARMAALQRELEVKRLELDLLAAQEQRRSEEQRRYKSVLEVRRTGKGARRGR